MNQLLNKQVFWLGLPLLEREVNMDQRDSDDPVQRFHASFILVSSP